MERVIFKFYGNVNLSTLSSAFYIDRTVEVEMTCATSFADVGILASLIHTKKCALGPVRAVSRRFVSWNA